MHKQRTLFNVIKTCLLWIFFYKFVVESKNCFTPWEKKRKSYWRSMIDYFYSAIHKVAGLPGTGRNALQRPFSHSRLKGFFHSTGIVPGKAGNSSASGFVNLWIALLIFKKNNFIHPPPPPPHPQMIIFPTPKHHPIYTVSKFPV